MDELFAHVVEFISQEWVRDIFWAVALAAVTAAVSHIVAKGLRAFLNRDDNPLPSSSIFVNIVRAVIWIIGGSTILDSCFGINPNALVTALGVGGIAISLGFQDTLSNLIGGVQMTIMRIVKPGDNIEVGTETGVVQDVSWRHTTITNARGETVIIPNSIISKTSLVQLPPVNQISIPFAVTSERPMDDVKADLLVAAKDAAAKNIPHHPRPENLFLRGNRVRVQRQDNHAHRGRQPGRLGRRRGCQGHRPYHSLALPIIQFVVARSVIN